MCRRTLIVLIGLFFLVTPVYGGSAQDISVQKDKAKQELQIKVRYPTRQPRNQYIRTIEVFIDDQAPIERRFSFQRGNFQKMTVPVPELAAVKKVTVKANPKTGTYIERTFSEKEIPEVTEEKAPNPQEADY
ncbi:MAG: hypothetical protein ABII88_05840 [Candidatus Omnitrophota bacterium]